MRLLLLTALTMAAFAANSILNRAGVASGDISAGQFAVVRVGTGALMLLAILALRRGRMFARPSLWAVLGLALYLVGFSQAYLSLDAGFGALLLFGGVQVTMFAGALIGREVIPPMRWLGMAVSFGGLVWLTGGAGMEGAALLACLSMLAAAFGWGIYSLVGRGATDPVLSTAWNFVGASLVVLALSWVQGVGYAGMSGKGVLLAAVSGAVTSALGYALWYAVLPRIGASQAAVAQLSVPVLALIGGAVLLGEPLVLRQVLAAAIVLGGIGLSLVPQARKNR